MDNSWLVASLVLALWLLSFSLQLGDLGTSWLSGRVAQAIPLEGRITRENLAGLFWVPPLVAIVVVVEGMGATFAWRLVADHDSLPQATLVVLALAALATAAWLLVVFAATRPEPRGYRDLVSALSAVEGERAARETIEQFRSELERLDRAEARAPIAVRAWRAVPVLVGIAALATGWAAIATSAPGLGWDASDTVPRVLGLALLPVLSFVVMVLCVRVATATSLEWHRVNAERRGRAVAALDDLDRRSARRVAGLGDRVSRALQILREQQATGPSNR